jgi:hypothetical protein
MALPPGTIAKFEPGIYEVVRNFTPADEPD